MKNIAVKILILVVAVAITVGAVLFFIKTIVSPPKDIKKVNAHEQNLVKETSSYNPDTLTLEEAEKEYNRLMDKATIFYGDSLISNSQFDNAVSVTTGKLASTFEKWSFSIFSKSQWNKSDLQKMTRLISRLRMVTIDNGNKRALQEGSSKKLTEIEGIIQLYYAAWGVAKRTRFVGYAPSLNTVSEAKQYSNNQYLQNCISLCNALDNVGQKLEKSRYWQLHARVSRLGHLGNFSSKEEYDNESTAVYDLIKEFKESQAFGVSTKADAETLGNMQDNFDRVANSYEW